MLSRLFILLFDKIVIAKIRIGPISLMQLIGKLPVDLLLNITRGKSTKLKFFGNSKSNFHTLAFVAQVANVGIVDLMIIIKFDGSLTLVMRAMRRL